MHAVPVGHAAPPRVLRADVKEVHEVFLGRRFLAGRGIALRQIVVAEGVTGIFGDDVLEIIHRHVVATDLHVVVLDEIHADLHLVGIGLELDRIDAGRADAAARTARGRPARGVRRLRDGCRAPDGPAVGIHPVAVVPAVGHLAGRRRGRRVSRVRRAGGAAGDAEPPVTVPVTNGFETIEIANVPLTAGNQTLRLAIDQGGFDLDWLEVDFAPGTADIIVDNLQTDKVTTSGSWSSSTSTPGYYASDYLAAAPGAIATAVFRPTLPRTCAYQISIHYPSQTASGIARVVIDPGDGGLSSTVLVDQRSGGGSWQSLGNFSLPAGTLATVSIAADGSPGYIHADALRFWEIDPVNNPPIVSLTAPDDGATVVSGAALTISAAASDPDLHSATPGVEKVKFYANDVLIGIDPSDSEDPATYSISFTPTDPGVYILTAVAYDFVGGVADSPSRTLYVVNPAGGLLTFSSPSYAISEGNGLASVTIRVQRTGGSGAVSVEYAISDGTASSSDYNATNGAMTWPEGDASDKLFSVAIIGETSPEADETVLLTLSNPTGDAALGTPSSASLVILDDDTTGSGIGSPTRPRSGVGSGSNCGSGSGIALLLALLALIATPIAHPARSRS